MQITRQQRLELYQQATKQLRDDIFSESFSVDTFDAEQYLTELQSSFPELSLRPEWLKHNAQEFMTEAEKLRRTRSDEAWRKIFPRYPIEKDGFARSFLPEQESEILECIEEFGLVVVKVFNDEECERSIQAIFEEVNAYPSNCRREKVQLEKPWTWRSVNWPSRSKFLVSDPAFHQQAFDNRCHDAVYHVFSTLWKEKHLMVNIDRWGIGRGTQDLDFLCEDGSIEKRARPDWGLRMTMHWDYNPWLFVSELESGLDPGYQSLLAFVDQDLSTGCHLTLPGGARFLPQWCRENRAPSRLGSKRRSHRPTDDDPILGYMQPIPIRKGELLVWSWGQLHSCTPNSSHRMRLHQYIGMFPAQDINPFYAIHENWSCLKVLRRYKEEFDLQSIRLNSRGEKLLGQRSWLETP